MIEIEIKIPPRQATGYKIRIDTQILESLWAKIESDFGTGGKFIITDENLVSAGHLQSLVGDKDVATYVINPPGEISKNIDTVVTIIEAMEKACLGRDAIVIALGGGTVGDIAGFAASIFKRGVPVIQIPTTTVAQADSAVGGKTGVDSSISKNAFGTFWHPAAVYIDVATLKSLEDRQYRAGLVESIKHAVIADSEYFEFLEQNLDAILDRNPQVLEKIARYNCKIKGGVVEADPSEKNQRRMLNYGHTIGHAVESATGYEMLHGECVAIGMIAAGLIEQEVGLSQPDRLDRIRKILEKTGMNLTLPPDLADDTLINLIKHDKKAVHKWPPFVLIDQIGQAHRRDDQWAVQVEPDVVKTVLDNLRKG